MSKYIELYSKIFEEFSVKEIISAIFGAFVYTSFITVPFVIIMGQVISVYLYLLTYWVVLIIIVMILLNYVFHHLIKQSLKLKHPEFKTNINPLILTNQIIIDIIFVIIGLLFLFVWIPILMV
ncbi:MAG: hypothetical protein PHW21_02160 [Candidatus Izemoplasmatales bacterium]|nr:hypothetical protein [Candidatus Izemoplasmatales bacterium]